MVALQRLWFIGGPSSGCRQAFDDLCFPVGLWTFRLLAKLQNSERFLCSPFNLLIPLVVFFLNPPYLCPVTRADPSDQLTYQVGCLPSTLWQHSDVCSHHLASHPDTCPQTVKRSWSKATKHFCNCVLKALLKIKYHSRLSDRKSLPVCNFWLGNRKYDSIYSSSTATFWGYSSVYLKFIQKVKECYV